jgi:uncharacterized membrane protein
MADRVTGSIVIDRSADDVYRLWTEYDSFPRFMKHIRSVIRTGPGTSHWAMKGPLGRDIEWDARVMRAEPGRLIAWESIRGDIQSDGQVNFRPIDADHTEVTVTVQYEPKESILNTVGSLFADPAGDLEDDLRNLKSFAEQTPSRR